MIFELDLDDLGRRVIYRDPHAGKVEEGVITSFNQNYVFVRYSGSTSAATSYKDLEWCNPTTKEMT